MHFLDAMTASPISTSVASEYLTREAAETWRPEQQIITYADKGRPFGTDLLLVSLVGANYLDAGGSWQGALPEESLWALAYYVQTLVELRDTDAGRALRDRLNASAAVR